MSKSIATLPEHDVFGVPAAQLSVDTFNYTEHRPLTSQKAFGQIEIPFTTAYDEYVNFKDLLFVLKLILDAGQSNSTSAITTIDAWDSVFFENNIHSCIKNVQLENNGKQVLSFSATYGYKAYIDTILCYSIDAQKSFLTACEFYEDNTARQALSKPA